MGSARPAVRPVAAAVFVAIAATALFVVAPRPCSAQVPAADHVIVIIMENRSYDQARVAPFTASLIDSGSSFSASYGITHPSQPNYLALWSGSTQAVTNDNCPSPGSPYTGDNLGQTCEAYGVSWKAYSENLPSAGSAACQSTDGLYRRKHAPWTNFANLDHANERPYTDLLDAVAGDSLPGLAFVVPNMCDDTHDCPVATGDAWLAANVPAMIEAVGPNGYVVLTWDEDDYASGNHILTVFVGGKVRHGYISNRAINHYTVLRTICESLGIPAMNAAATILPITDVWRGPSTSVGGSPPGGVRLGPAAPNPATGRVEILLSLAAPAVVSAEVYDVSGRRVAVLLRGPLAGEVRLSWDRRTSSGRPAPSGTYFVRVQVAGQTLERKVTVTR
jgi:hypothetical protein